VSATLAADLEVICDAPRQTERVAGTVEQRAVAIAAYVDARVRTPDARSILGASPDELLRRLAEAVRRVGLARCPLLEQAATAEGAARAAADPERPAGADPPPATRPAPADLTAALLERVIAGHLPALRQCYQRELLDRPVLRAASEVGFTIRPDGTVTAVGFTPGFGNARLEGCLQRVLERMTFPPPRDGEPVTVSHTLRLEAAR
jgi:hypothetical protein